VTTRRKIIASALLLILLLLTAALAPMSLAVALFGPPPLPYGFLPHLPGDLLPGRDVQADGARTQERAMAGSLRYRYTTNALGFRGPEVRLVPGAEVCLVLGDGYAFGTGVDQGKSIPGHLSALLPRAGSLVVLNGGMPGYTITDELSYMEEKGARLRPRLTVIIHSQDDVWEMARPVVVREETRRITENLGYLLIFQWRRFYHGLFRMQDSVLDDTRLPPQEAYRALVPAYVRQSVHLATLVRGWGGRLLLVADQFEDQVMAESLRREGLSLVLLSDSSPRVPLPSLEDGHWSSEGNRRVALVILSWMQRNGVL